jgi:catechol 2,3-dioxygenase
MSSSTYSPHLSHMGIACIDIDNMIEFYTTVFRMQVSDKGPGRTFPYMLAFLSGTPDQHHQLVLAQNRPVDSQSTVMQISFMVQTLDDLREAKARALRHGATEMRGLNHGNAISIYFADPEKNTFEVYLDTPWYVSQPHGDPLDLDDSDAQIWADTERVVRADPSFQPVEQWSAKFKVMP